MEIASVIDTGRASLPDPVAATEATEAMVRSLEAIGAAVESERTGEAFFVLDGLRGIHRGDSAGVLAAARRAVGEGPRIATGPTRFAAFAAARGWPLPLPVAALGARLDVPEREAAEFLTALERLGIETLPALARLSPDQVADRFGPLGLRALRLARGEDEPLRPRTPHEELVEQIELPEGTAGRQLDRALELLVDRLLAAPQRRGRTLLGLRLGALLSGGGSWSIEQGLGRPSASARVLRTVLLPRLEDLPGPAEALRLRALGFGPPAGDQLELSVGGSEPRRRRLGEAVREVRAAQGAEALLRILPVESGSRVPERWAMLTPFPEL
ncbi:MAG: protein ImuB [Solirubrobacterales bacterium]|jgi:protein ImuB|nr:protein ImuB [Solirubrobacterales bacterium]